MENSQKLLDINQTEFYITCMLQVMEDFINSRMSTKQENCLLILFKKPSTMNIAMFSDKKDSHFIISKNWELETSVIYLLILVNVFMYHNSL